jgi:hypothetical protein
MLPFTQLKIKIIFLCSFLRLPSLSTSYTVLTHDILQQYTWTYVAGEGRYYHVGHLLIYVGAKIVVIDFKVFESKSYTFFIEDELCVIRLERRQNEMYYHFEIDRNTDTPRNLARRKTERRFLWQAVLAFAIFGVVAAAGVLALKKMNEHKDSPAALLASEGRESIGSIRIGAGNPPEVSYQFIAENKAWTGKVNLPVSLISSSENGMPLETGDEFTVTYAASNPAVNRIEFGRPTAGQTAAYQQRAVAKQVALHPEEAKQTSECKVKVAFELSGTGGLADFFFQDVAPEINKLHNRNTFLRLTRDLLFQKRVGEKCY